MKPLIYTKKEWNEILENIKRDHPPSIYMIREKMRRKLGFTTREHTAWEPGMIRYKTLIHLDFYDEKFKTMFLLKYHTKLYDTLDNEDC